LKIIDNFLFDDYFKELQNLVSSNNFGWFYQDKTTTYQKDKNFMFVHTLYNNSINSPHYTKFEPIKYFINQHTDFKKLKRMKLNLYTNRNERIKHLKHYDYIEEDHQPTKNIKILILNFSTCNGSTIVEEKEIVSQENKAILFKNEQAHYGIIQDDKNIRIVLNIVFI